MYVITAHQRHRQTDRQTDVKRSHDRYIAKACSGKKVVFQSNLVYQLGVSTQCCGSWSTIVHVFVEDTELELVPPRNFRELPVGEVSTGIPHATVAVRTPRTY